MKSRRTALGIRPEQIAIDTDRSADAIRAYETGRNTPPANVLAQIAKALGCSIDDLFVEEVGGEEALR